MKCKKCEKNEKVGKEINKVLNLLASIILNVFLLFGSGLSVSVLFLLNLEYPQNTLLILGLASSIIMFMILSHNYFKCFEGEEKQ